MKRLTYIFRYIKHFFEANSRHGTHSPFVYALAEDVIYKRSSPKGKTKKGYEGLLQEIADYYQVRYTHKPDETGEDRALWIRGMQFEVDELASYQHQFRYIVIEQIHASAKESARWAALQRDDRFVVTVDMFFFGLLFYRTEQPKQHFKLRYPFWK